MDNAAGQPADESGGTKVGRILPASPTNEEQCKEYQRCFETGRYLPDGSWVAESMIEEYHKYQEQLASRKAAQADGTNEEISPLPQTRISDEVTCSQVLTEQSILNQHPFCSVQEGDLGVAGGQQETTMARSTAPSELPQVPHDINVRKPTGRDNERVPYGADVTGFIEQESTQVPQGANIRTSTEQEPPQVALATNITGSTTNDESVQVPEGTNNTGSTADDGTTKASQETKVVESTPSSQCAQVPGATNVIGSTRLIEFVQSKETDVPSSALHNESATVQPGTDAIISSAGNSTTQEASASVSQGTPMSTNAVFTKGRPAGEALNQLERSDEGQSRQASGNQREKVYSYGLHFHLHLVQCDVEKHCSGHLLVSKLDRLQVPTGYLLVRQSHCDAPHIVTACVNSAWDPQYGCYLSLPEDVLRDFWSAFVRHRQDVLLLRQQVGMPTPRAPHSAHGTACHSHETKSVYYPQQPTGSPRQQRPSGTLKIAVTPAHPGIPLRATGEECSADSVASQRQQRKTAQNKTNADRTMDFMNQLMNNRVNSAEGSQPRRQPPPGAVESSSSEAFPNEKLDTGATGSEEGGGSTNTRGALPLPAHWDHELQQYVVHSQEHGRDRKSEVGLSGGGLDPRALSVFGYRVYPDYILDLKLGHWACKIRPGQPGFGCPCCRWNSGRFAWECSYRQSHLLWAS